MAESDLVSIVIPSRNEIFLNKTVEDLLAKARGPIEIIVILDGYWPTETKREHWSTPAIVDDPRVRYVHKGNSEGMRKGINDGVALAKGKYIMKIDAHCLLDEGYDIKLKVDCEPNWVIIPRRKRLDAEKWEVQDVGKPDIDAMFLSYPSDDQDWGGASLHGKLWESRTKERKDVLIDDEMSFQGSCWFMHREYFYELELMDDDNYGPFWNEAQEIGNKAWLSGGMVKRNKKTWYAHLHKGKTYGRGYSLPGSWLNKGAEYTKKWMTGEAWHKQTKPLSSLIEHFWPVPTWTEEGLSKLKEYELKYKQFSLIEVKNAEVTPFELQKVTIQKPLFESYKQFKRIIVTGPQRSGTRIMAQAIAQDTGHTYIDEKMFDVSDLSSFEYLIGQENIVIQAPAMCHRIEDYANDETLIVMVMRPILEILESQNRVNWDAGEKDELLKYVGYSNIRQARKDGVNVCELKYLHWEDQKPLIKHWREIDYHYLENHPLWEDKRKDFAANQTNGKLKNRIELARLFNDLGFKKGVEVGVCDGRYSEILLQEILLVELIGVDPYTAYADDSKGRTQDQMNGKHQQAIKRLEKYDNYRLVVAFSAEAAKLIPDESLDFVFIDANHKYEYVKEDIEIWFPKVRKGGIVSGHDYYEFPSGRGGVIPAVNEFVEKHGQELQTTEYDPEAFIDDRQPDWYFIKK